MDHLKLLTGISILIFLTFIPLAIINQTYGWIPDTIIFIFATLFYYWMYATFRMTPFIFLMLILAHILHACGIFGWYHISPLPIGWERITHFFGALPFALLFFRFFEQWMDTRFFTKKNMALLLSVFLCATAVGAIVELNEFIGYLNFGYGEGAFRFGPGDGVVGLDGVELIDAIGGGWINQGFDMITNTLGILVGMAIMIGLKLATRRPEKAYYFEPVGEYSRRI